MGDEAKKWVLQGNQGYENMERKTYLQTSPYSDAQLDLSLGLGRIVCTKELRLRTIA